MKKSILALASLILGSVLILSVAAQSESNGLTARLPIIAESSLLNGLAAGALFPFIDTTPNNIAQAHIAITDATSNCAPGAAAPSNIQVLVGVAGGALVNVMTAATNTGIGSTTQCVFHVTVAPGENGVPGAITDIVVVNAGGSALTGVNTVTASAEVKLLHSKRED
jgi:hypothetical protein